MALLESLKDTAMGLGSFFGTTGNVIPGRYSLPKVLRNTSDIQYMCNTNKRGNMRKILAVVALVGFVGCGGSPGATGAAGPQGATGTGLTITSSFSCTKSAGGYLFTYEGVKYSTGDVWVECSAAGNSFQAGTTQVYRPSQSGAASYGCVFILDADATPSGGYWNFSNTSVRQGVYNDSTSASNGFTVTFASTDCTSL